MAEKHVQLKKRIEQLKDSIDKQELRYRQTEANYKRIIEQLSGELVELNDLRTINKKLIDAMSAMALLIKG